MKILNTSKKTTIITIRLLTILFFWSSFYVVSQETITAQITTKDGVNREYILYIPKSYTGHKKVPLLFNFHGYRSNAEEQMLYGDFRSIADREGFIIVHPQGTIDIVGSTHFNVGWQRSTVDDVAFTDELIDEISSKYTINSRKIYSTGFSNGGFMSYQLACKLSNRIAAIASVGGSMTIDTPTECSPSRLVPSLQIHGTDDGTVPYEGAGFSEPIEGLINFWVGLTNAYTIPKVELLEDIDTEDNSTVEHFVYTNHRGKKSIVEHYKIENGGHTWPGAAIDLPEKVTNHDFNASEVIWEFLSKNSIKTKINNFKYTVYPNPASDQFTIFSKNFAVGKTFKLISKRNKKVAEGTIASESHRVNVSHIRKGTYFLKIGKETSIIYIK